MTLTERIIKLLDNSPIYDDEELFVEMTREAPGFDEKVVRAAYRQWNTSKSEEKKRQNT